MTERPRKTKRNFRLAGNFAEIRTGYFLNTILESYRMTATCLEISLRYDKLLLAYADHKCVINVEAANGLTSQENIAGGRKEEIHGASCIENFKRPQHFSKHSLRIIDL
jgi:hypothetical protein